MNNNKKMDISVGEILYWLFFGCLLFVKGVGTYDGQIVFKIALIFSVMCIGIKLCIEQYSITEIIKIVIIVGLTGVSYIISGEKGMFLYGLMVIGMKNVNVKRLFVIGTTVWTIAFAGLTISSLFRMEDTVYKVHDKLGMGHIFRWSLGYSHPNVLHISYVVLVMFIIFILGEKFRIKHAVYLFVGNCLVFLYSVSYTGFLVFMYLMTGRIYLLMRKKLCKTEKVLAQLVFPICVVVSLLFPVVLEGKLFDIVNKILSTRLALAKYYLTSEFISLFGKRTSEITSRVLTMDNAYLFAFITYGIVFFVTLYFTTIWMIYKLVKKEQYLELLIVLAICIAGLTEPFLYNTSFKNLSFIFMGNLLFTLKDNKSKYSIIPIKWIRDINKHIELNAERFKEVEEKLLFLIKARKGKIIVAIVGALVAETIVSVVVDYPKGYVVYRIDSADIGEELHYYDDNAEEYRDYLRMEDFQVGEKIEFFSGNIVMMEQIRVSVMSALSGFAICYIGFSLICYRRKEANVGE